MQINKIFIKLMNDEEVTLKNPEQVSQLIKYCKSIAGEYDFNIKINKNGVKLSLNYGN